MRTILIYFYHKYDGDQQLIRNAIEGHERVDSNELNKFKTQINENDYLTILDDNYPEALKRVFNPPIVLYKNDFKLS